jgi:hypothetical protein
MHIVPEDQKRPKKGRTAAERVFRRVNDITMLVQLVCWLYYTSTLTRRGATTMATDLWAGFPSFVLSPVLEYKLTNCSFTTVASIYAFSDMNMTLNKANSTELIADLIGHMRLIVIISAFAMLVGGLNKLLFSLNVFHWRYHHLYLHKDILTAVEVVMLGYQMMLLITVEPQKELIGNFFRYCGVKQSNYLPFLSSASLWVFFGVTVGVHAFSILFHLLYALPKDGFVDDADDADPNNPPVWMVLQSMINDKAERKKEEKKARRQHWKTVGSVVSLGNSLRNRHVGPDQLGASASVEPGSLRMASPRTPSSNGGQPMMRKAQSSSVVGPPPPPPTFFNRQS